MSIFVKDQLLLLKRANVMAPPPTTWPVTRRLMVSVNNVEVTPPAETKTRLLGGATPKEYEAGLEVIPV